MGWVCPNCSNPNEESSSSCFVCGATRPSTTVEEVPSIKGSVVFSDFAVWKELKRQFFKRISAPPKRTERPRTIASTSERKAKPPKEKKVKKRSGGSGFAKPWSDHAIKFDIDIIKNKGYVRSEQKELNGIKGYVFYREDGSSQFIRMEMILIQKMAHKLDR